MPTYRRTKQSGSWWKILLLMAAALLIGGAGTVGTLAATGTVDLASLAFWRTKPLEEPRIPPGAVAVPISARPIPAYTKLTRDHLFNAKTGKFAFVYLMPDQLQPGMLVKLSDLMGRVLDHDKPAGYAFTERDFLPEGTREGITAGVPPGKRAYRLDASKVAGVHGLQAGDHVDLVASVPLDAKGRGVTLLPASRVGPQPAKQADIRVIVQDGVIVSPVTMRAVPMTTSSLTQGARTTTRPVQEIVIAVEPDEVPRLSEAESLEYSLTAVAHSGHPDRTVDARITTRRDDSSSARIIESIVGTKRQTVYFPPSSRSPIKLEQTP